MAFAIDLPLKPRKMENNQTSSECKYYDCEYCAHPDHYCKGHLQNICDLEHELVEHCPDYEPKEKKDNEEN